MPLKNRRILIIEDEFFIADDLRKAISGAGAEVIGPINAVREALAIVKDGKAIDAALLDLNLRGEIALDVADALAARRIPFMFTTGYDEGAIPSSHGNVARLEKPNEPDAVVRQLETLLTRPA